MKEYWTHEQFEKDLSQKHDNKYEDGPGKRFENQAIENVDAKKLCNIHHETDDLQVDACRIKRNKNGKIVGVDLFAFKSKESAFDHGKGLFINEFNLNRAKEYKQHIDNYWLVYELPSGKVIHLDLLEFMGKNKKNIRIESFMGNMGIFIEEHRKAWKEGYPN